MAKARPRLTLQDMERQLGFRIEPSKDHDINEERFFTDLQPVPKDVFGLTEIEFSALQKSHVPKDQIISKSLLLTTGNTQVHLSSTNVIPA